MSQQENPIGKILLPMVEHIHFLTVLKTLEPVAFTFSAAKQLLLQERGQEFVPKHFIGKLDLHQRTYAVMDFSGNSGSFCTIF